MKNYMSILKTNKNLKGLRRLNLKSIKNLRKNYFKSDDLSFVTQPLETKKLIKRSQELGSNVEYSLTELVLKTPQEKLQDKKNSAQKKLF